ncbi:helix-turn-helix family protein [Mycolicibacterium hassiacum DSM 44199]|jgi:transcriptional regulator with XRE-family HTH domain|uniref:Helix-turn-helix family protein n=1 Tax=Mycolicibacterium hassiacum (strain DSM 44199 / CIP 105218 / JCM 12690 / 3849) TaxID=1122247 RepID=K5B8Q1_MYCHD|nr:helix-turn-helix transcriptional regulator [Mycolicibacterium hassiacum]EKF24088.1 helix-turn-helix family protein [Mycolicibacterium hassiacum DSM 44199]MBX5489052.1 helix-turn-helix transcriptional regulator [Mycolicibacterium hassiacum]MDA4085163.1 XRE family transcriptional regulator [Mycolicibacterium hassiacum DSM 44199]VCT90673.1 Transcriptional regulator ClgR [Mycolicibacterium hassiacum DSM 44199]
MATLLREVIGDVLRRARTEQGRTLREVSDSARVSLGYLSEIERGRKEASSELLNAICNALEVPLSRVLIDAGIEVAREEQALAGDAALEPAVDRAASLDRDGVRAGRDGTRPAAAAGAGASADLPAEVSANIDVTTKVVIPQPVSMAVA